MTLSGENGQHGVQLMHSLPIEEPSEGPVNYWSTNKTSYWRNMKALLRKSYLTKIRDPISIFEVILGCVVFLLVYPVYYVAKLKYPAHQYPPVMDPYQPGPELVSFLLGTGNASIIGIPNNTITQMFLNQTFEKIFEALHKPHLVDIQYVETVEQMQEIVYKRDSNGMGINWKNSEQDNRFTSPEFAVYTQSFFVSPSRDMFHILRKAASQASFDPHLTNLNIYQQVYATPSVTDYLQIQMIIALFGVFPIVIAAMPDIQSILLDKDTKVASLMVLMGCPESAYWLVSFITCFILSLLPYFGYNAMLCYWFGMVGSSYSMMLLISVAFVFAHTWFTLFLTTFFRKAKQGRVLIVIFGVFAFFFVELHYNYTLSPNNTNQYMKHIFSIIPFSSYEMFIISANTYVIKKLEPIGWEQFNEDISYNPELTLFWLIADSVIYFVLFVIFNAINPREFGSPPIRISELFSPSAWKRLRRKVDRTYSSSGPVVQVLNAGKVYGKRNRALKDVTFSLNSGEVIVVIGPNGAGKSTLINLMTGAIESTEGSIRVFGEKESKNFSIIQKYLGVCFQDNVLIDLLSVREHFEIFGVFRGMTTKEISESRETFCDSLQLTQVMDSLAGDLSGGQKRKLCISLSLLGNPPIVVMDEPTAGVDLQSRQTIWKTIAALRNTTVLVTSHALEEAEAVCSRMFIISKGNLAFQGTSTQLRKQYDCGYLLRVEMKNGWTKDLSSILHFVRQYAPEADLSIDRDDTITVPVMEKTSELIKALDASSKDLGILEYSFGVEQIEDVLIKMQQTHEAAFEPGHD